MILDGRTVANQILQQLSQRVHILQEKYNTRPHLAVVSVGNDPATMSYISQKDKKAREIGAIVSVYNHPESISQKELQQTIDFLQDKGDTHGLILQLPIPKSLDAKELISTIHPEKDVDGFVKDSPFIVPIASAIFKLLEVPCIKETAETGESYNDWLRSKKVVVMGKGPTGGAPISNELRKREVNVEIIDSSTPNPSLITKSADIIITATGKRGLLTKDMIKKDVILLNIGMTLSEDGKFYGDYTEEDIASIASWYTPTPGGVGPVNVACLMENLVIATERAVGN